MRMTFKAAMLKEWTLLDDRIIVGGKKIVMLSDIHKYQYTPPKGLASNGVIQVFVGKTFYTLAFPKKVLADGEAAAKYIEHAVYGGDKPTEVRMRCNVCGHVFCYNEADLKEARRKATGAILSSVGAMGGALNGNYTASAVNQGNADRQLNSITDFSRCPNCRSNNLTNITFEPLQPTPPQPAAAQPAAPVSAADELVKMKGLLDQGIITQEEFDAKKKQLLGL